jgi:hypothetical protein
MSVSPREPTDEESVAALLAVLALVGQDGHAVGAAGAAPTAGPLGRWRAQRMAALAGTRSNAGIVAASTPSSVRPDPRPILRTR